jgi:Glycosyltransferase family 87
MTTFSLQSTNRAQRLALAADRLGWVAVGLGGLLLSFVTISTIVAFAPVGRTFADWLTYMHAVDRMFAGLPIYAPEQLNGQYVLVNVTLFGYAYPPSSVPLFLPFASYPVGLVAWLTVNVGLLITGVIAILKRERGRVRPLELALALLVLGFFPGFADGVAWGNASVGLAGCLAWAWVMGRGRMPVGGFAGLGATIKLVPGALIFWSTPRTFPRVLVGAAAVAGALFVLTLPLVGLASWADYVTALSFSEPACGVDVPVSLACLLKPMIGIGPAKLAGILLALGAGIAAVFVRASLASFGLVVVAWLAPVTDLHFHYLLVIYVLAVIAGARWRQRWTTRAAVPGDPLAAEIRTA